VTAWDIYRTLPAPTAPHRYSVALSARGFRVGRSVEGFAAILIAVPPGSSTSPRRLVNLWYAPPAQLDLVGEAGARETACLAVLECRTADSSLCEYFLRVVDAVLVSGDMFCDGDEVERALDRLVSLFRCLSKPGVRTVEGLWGELAMISWASDPAIAVAAWHSEPRALYDFSGHTDRLEVKSTLKKVREHSFNVDQTASADDGTTLVASLMLTAGEHGTSIFQLVETIGERLGGASEVRSRLEAIVIETLGEGWRDAGVVRFLLEPARASLRLYDARTIPRIRCPLPPEIKEIRYVADLSTTPSLGIDMARRRGLVFDGMMPGDAAPASNVREAP